MGKLNITSEDHLTTITVSSTIHLVITRTLLPRVHVQCVHEICGTRAPPRGQRTTLALQFFFFLTEVVHRM